MNNKWMLAVLIAVVALLAGVGILSGVNVAVTKAITPVGGQLKDIAASQKDIQKKLEAPAVDIKALTDRLAALEAKVKSLEGQLSARPQKPAAVAEPEEKANVVHEIPVGSTPVFGKADAPITITIFSDYQCPFCGRFYPAAKEAVNAYPGKVKLVLKHFPLSFHQMAKPASKAAMAAAVQGKYYEMSELLMQNAATLSEEKFKEFAKTIGLKVDQFMKDYKGRDAEWEKQITEDMELASKVGVRGTPSYYLNGKTTGARTIEQWKQEIDAILAAPKK